MSLLSKIRCSWDGQQILVIVFTSLFVNNVHFILHSNHGIQSIFHSRCRFYGSRYWLTLWLTPNNLHKTRWLAIFTTVILTFIKCDILKIQYNYSTNMQTRVGNILLKFESELITRSLPFIYQRAQKYLYINIHLRFSYSFC